MPSARRTTPPTASRARSGRRTARKRSAWPGGSRPASSPSTRTPRSGSRPPSAASSSPASGASWGPTPSTTTPRSRTSTSRRRAASMPGRLEGKVAVITGAASGIGRESARRFAEEGAKVVVADLADEPGLGVAKEVDGLYVRADVTDPNDVQRMYGEASEYFGTIDVLFNNAGISPPDDDSILETEVDAWERVQNVNLKSVYLCCKHGIPHLLERGGGSVINTASFVAVMGAATSQISYTASKGGVLAMSRELGVQFARQGVRVNALCPGPVNTPLLQELFAKDPEKAARGLVPLPMGRFAEAVEIANAALFLASDESSYVNASTFLVDGGLSGAYVTPE